MATRGLGQGTKSAPLMWNIYLDEIVTFAETIRQNKYWLELWKTMTEEYWYQEEMETLQRDDKSIRKIKGYADD